MPISTAVARKETVGYEIVYRSLGELAEDNARIAEGNVLVPWSDLPPKVGSFTVVRLGVPGGGVFDLPGFVEAADTHSFRVALDGSARGAQNALSQIVTSPAFQSARGSEIQGSKRGREVSLFVTEVEVPVERGPSPTAKPAVPAARPAPAAAAPKPLPRSGTDIDRDVDDDSADLSDEVSDEISDEVSDAAPAAARPAAPAVAAAPARATPAALDDDASSEVSAEDDESAETRVLDRYDDYDDMDPDDDEIGTQESDDDQGGQSTVFRAPGPGESYVVFVIKFATILDYLPLVEDFAKTARFNIDQTGETSKEGGLAQLRLVLPGRNIFTMYAVFEKVTPTSVTLMVNKDSPTFLNATVFHRSLAGKKRLDTEREDMRRPVDHLRFVEERSKEDLDSLPLRRRIARMGMDDKINLALSGSREERMALAIDGNKAIHHYLLKNARISLDEVAFIARLPTMNPDVLARIAESPSYVQNQTVLKNLIYNPKTPIPVAIRLIDRLPRGEVMNLAKRTSMNLRLVMAAKKRLEKGSK